LPHPDKFEQHLLVTEDLDSVRGVRLPPNINRYARRSIEMDIGSTNKLGFTFTKMGPIAVLGFYYLAEPREWTGGKVHVTGGPIGPTTYKLPQAFIDYLIGRARRYGAIHDQMSPKQRDLANKTTADGFSKNQERVVNSHWLRAMRRDVEQFGEQAFGEDFPGEPDRKK
jgi:hypothetical protein